MNDKKFDNMIKAQMAGYNSQLNVDDLWSAIEPSIIKPTFVDGGFLSDIISSLLGKKMLLLFTAVGICMGTAYLMNQYANNDSNFNNNLNSSPALIQTETEEGENLKEDIIEEEKLDNEKIDLPKENDIEKEIKEDLEIENEEIFVDKAIKNTEEKVLEVSKEKKALVNLEQTKSQKKNTKRAKEINKIKHNTVAKKQDAKISKNNKQLVIDAPIVKPFISNDRDENLPMYQFMEAYKNDKTEKNIENEVLVKPDDEKLNEKKKYPTLNELKTLNSNTILSTNKNVLSTEESSPVFIQDCPTFKQTTFKNFVEPYAGIAFAPSILTEKSNELGRSLAGLRDSLETSLETFKTGVVAGAHHKKKNFGVMTGLQFSRIAERMDIETTEVTFNEIPNQIIKQVVNLNNDTIDIFGTVIEEVTTIKKQTLYNNYRMYDIPVIVEYNFQDELNQRWLYFNVQAGINANFKLNANGAVLDTMQNLVNLDDVTRNQLGLTYFASAGVNLALKNSIVLRAAPTVKIIPKSIMQEEYEINQRYNIYGLNFGARWYFSR